MKIDLARLRDLHPLLPLPTALGYTQRAALGLGRRGHSSGVTIKISLEENERKGVLTWEKVDLSEAEQIDSHRITEDAAEAIALALVKVSNNWTVRRRAMRGESADWFLRDSNQHVVALEISGINGIDLNGARMKEKLLQVAKCRTLGTKAACVIELQPPGVRMGIVP